MKQPAPTYSIMIQWIALNDRGASPVYRKLSDYYTLVTVQMLASVFDRSITEVAADVVHAQCSISRAIDEA